MMTSLLSKIRSKILLLIHKIRLKTNREKYLKDNDLTPEATGIKQSVIDDILKRHKKASSVFVEVALYLVTSARAEDAEKYYLKALSLRKNVNVFSSYLQSLLFSSTTSNKKMYEEFCKYKDYVDVGSGKQKFRFNNLIDPNKKLRVGHICCFFHNDVSKSLLLPQLAVHDRKNFEIYCYSDADKNLVSDEVRSYCDAFRDTKGMSDKQFADLVRNDEIDILIELNGHCSSNRYAAMAKYKPAPVQVNFYNMSATCGVPNIDYILIGNITPIEAEEKYYSEKVHYFPGAWGTAKFDLEKFPKVADEIPYVKNNYITFGSFGAAHKITREQIKLWCEVMKKVPESRFFLKAGALTEETYAKEYMNDYVKYFNDNGISKDRLIIEGYDRHQDMLKKYANLDIALDTYPFAAGTTTMEALFMGIPVVSMYGETLASQHGRGVMNTVGHPELVAKNRQEFIDIAVDLANDIDRIKKYRQSLRNDYINSDKYDVEKFARDIEWAYRDIWIKYCKEEKFKNERK